MIWIRGMPILGVNIMAKFYKRTVNIVDEHRLHHLDEKKKNPNYNATYNLYGFAWAFKDSIPIVNLDPTPAKKIQAWFDSSIPFFNGIVDEDGKSCGDDFVLISKDNSIDEDCNVCEDASAGLSKDEIVNDKLVDEDCNVCEDASAGLSKDEIVNDKLVDKDCNVCEDASASLYKDNVVNEKYVGNNDKLLLEDGDGLFDLKAGCRNSEEDNENQPANVSIRDLYVVVKVHGERIANLERLLKEKQPNDYAAENTKPNMIPNHSDDISSCSVLDLNSNQTGVDQELGGAANDPMLVCSYPDMHTAEVDCDGMAIDKPYQMNDYNCSQPIPASVDALIQACAYASDHPELDVLQHEAHVDRSGPKINEHLTTEPLTVDEFQDDYMSVLIDEEINPNVSLDDMKFQHEDENFPVKDTPLEHQPVDELIDAQKDSTNLLPENVKDEINKSKYVNVVKAGYKPPLETVFAEISGQPKIRSLNELMTLQVFVENLSRPDGCKKDNVIVPYEISEFLKMQDPPEYRFPWRFRDLIVDRIFCLQLACLNLAKKAGWERIHWCLAELQISTGVVTFYDTLGWVKGNRRPWWRNMKRNFPQQLTSYLNEHGVLASKGISVEKYEIKCAFPNVVRHADDSGDCGVWVCIFYTSLFGYLVMFMY
ncbi:phospholipase-like protein [Tanacetum coccineum]